MLSCALFALALCAVCTPASAEKRVALVIGNAAYRNTTPLANPRNDATDVAAALKALGFETILETDLDKRGMDDAFRRFARLAREADAAVFYYAGHGMQFAGSNYLMPVDAKLQDEADLSYEMARVDDVVSDLARARNIRILILDACRDNPLADRLRASLPADRSAAMERGLRRPERSHGLITAFATQHGQTAKDGVGGERNSPFTAGFLKHVATPGIEAGTLFRRVAQEVSRATGGRQLPELSISLLGEFYFAGLPTTVTPSTPALSEPARVDPCAAASDHWRSAETMGSLAAFEDHLARFPTCAFAGLASAKIDELRKRTAVVVPSTLPPTSPGPATAWQPEPRIAFVLGNADYTARPVQTALSDAGLVAEALRSIGFEVVDGANLTQADSMRLFREFLAKVESAGPEALVFVYFSGYGVQYDGDNFLLSAAAKLARESDIPREGIRLSDVVGPLAVAPGRAKVVAVDASRPLPFQIPGRRIARGLGAVDSPLGMLIAFSSAPGTAAEEGAAYGPYATAIAEMVRNPGLDLDAVFVRIRARTHQISEGQQTPWHISALAGNVRFVPADAQADVSAPPPPLRIASGPKPMREVGPDEGYAQAIELDTLSGYVEFVSAYPRDAYAPRIWAIIRARREALAWLRAVQLNTPPAYWTYLRRYPDGICAADAALRLRRLSAPLGPPPSFAPVEFFDVPPPLADEPVAFVERLPPAPPPPVVLIAPPPPFFARLPPPPPRRSAAPGVLPVPVVIPVVPRLAPARPVVRPPTPAASASKAAPAAAAKKCQVVNGVQVCR